MLTWVIQEALRIQPPADYTSDLCFSQSVKVGNLNIRKGDEFQIYMSGLHMNEDEWRRPYEFIPRRFDLSCPLSTKPDGTRRTPAAYAPYVGGKRICLGKTLAEAQLKITATYLT